MSSEAVLNQPQTSDLQNGLAVMEVTGRVGVQGEGPYMTISLKLEAGKIVEASFQTYGCPSALKCGSFITNWVKGRTPEQVRIITAGDLITVVGGLTLGKEH